MKKGLVALAILTLLVLVGGCTNKTTKKLTVMNVGDYINPELVTKFEKEYNCSVTYREEPSNESIYNTFVNDGSYDVLVVSDYMIDRLNQEGRIEKLDYPKLTNYKTEDLFGDAKDLLSNQCSTYNDYFMPYFWGTVGILYRNDIVGLEKYVQDKGLKAIFEPSSYKRGMYDSARDAVCSAVLANGGTNINTTDTKELEDAKNLIKNANFNKWGTDSLKGWVNDGDLDMALVYSGDYLDQIYVCNSNNKTVNFSYFAPDITNIWIDGMVINANSKEKDLAYSFLNFFSEVKNQAENADYIGYCPLSEPVFNLLYSDYEYDYPKEEFYPYKSGRQMYTYVSSSHYQILNNLLNEARARN